MFQLNNKMIDKIKKIVAYFSIGIVVGWLFFFGLPKLKDGSLFFFLGSGLFFIRPTLIGGYTTRLYLEGLLNSVIIGLIFTSIYKIFLMLKKSKTPINFLFTFLIFFSLGVYLAYEFYVWIFMSAWSNFNFL